LWSSYGAQRSQPPATGMVRGQRFESVRGLQEVPPDQLLSSSGEATRTSFGVHRASTTAFWWSVGIFALGFLLAMVILPGRVKARVPTVRAALARHAICNCTTSRLRMAPGLGLALRRALRGNDQRPVGVCRECVGDATEKSAADGWLPGRVGRKQPVGQKLASPTASHRNRSSDTARAIRGPSGENAVYAIKRATKRFDKRNPRVLAAAAAVRATLVRSFRLKRDPQPLDTRRVPVLVEPHPRNPDPRIIVVRDEALKQAQLTVGATSSSRIQDALRL
jgi:hypothetical protein